MNLDQGLLFALLAGLFILFIWGRWRYDLVAFAALVVAVAIGVVPAEGAFSGFGHPATIIIALVLIVSRGLTNAGVVELVASRVVDASRPLAAHIGTMAGVTAVMSAVMNNVAALALLMPVDLQASAKAGRSPAITLMPLSFASILGGLVTLIGTPPNIIIASFREQEFGTPFGMFDFTPVGGLCAIAGVLFVTLVGWRLVPAARAKVDAGKELKALEEFITELRYQRTPTLFRSRSASSMMRPKRMTCRCWAWSAAGGAFLASPAVKRYPPTTFWSSRADRRGSRRSREQWASATSSARRTRTMF